MWLEGPSSWERHSCECLHGANLPPRLNLMEEPIWLPALLKRVIEARYQPEPTEDRHRGEWVLRSEEEGV